MNEIEYIFLETLSFFDPMTKEQIILDLDSDLLLTLNKFSLEDFDKVLNRMVRAGNVVRIEVNGEPAWMKKKKKSAGSIKSFFLKKFV